VPLGIRLLALDLDGTLVDSAPDLTHCVGAALAALGLPQPTEDETRGWIGDGIDTLLVRALHAASGRLPDAAELARALRAFDACYDVNVFVRSRVYPGVADTLGELRARGIVLGCVTNKRYTYAKRLLALAGLDAHCRFVLGGDSCPAKKPDPAQLVAASAITGIACEAAALVGDSGHDQAAAARAGFRFIWAAYGYGMPASEPAMLRIDAFDDVLGIIDG
jgi:phosphoglycolate phosphatase